MDGAVQVSNKVSTRTIGGREAGGNACPYPYATLTMVGDCPCARDGTTYGRLRTRECTRMVRRVRLLSRSTGLPG